MHLDFTTGGGQVVPIATLKYDNPIYSFRRRRSANVLHLGTVAVDMVELEATFTAAMNGTRVDEGEFDYTSPDGYLHLTNIGTATGIGIAEDSQDTYAIPINYIEREPVILTNIYEVSQPV